MITLQLYVVPTYNCNLECNKCYSKKYLNDFQDDLSWKDFIKTVQYFKGKYDNYAFIGGEPATWKFINEAILYLKNKRKKVSVFTNGTIQINVVPNNIILNGNNLFNTEINDEIINNLRYYKKNNGKITLRFNINELFSDTDIMSAVSLSKKYSDSVSLSILYPITMWKGLGGKIYNFSKELFSNSIPVKISRATPFCLFDNDQREFLIENCKLKGKCSLPTNSVVINPDGRTIQPCVELDIRRDITELKNSSPIKVFSEDIKTLIADKSSQCPECTIFSTKCWGGCLSYNTKIPISL